MIGSRQNPRFKAALGLRDARERRERRRTLVDGAREIGRALDAGFRVAEAWVCPDRVRGEAARTLLPRLTASAGQVLEISAELLARLAYGERDEGIVVVVETPASVLEALDLPERPLVAVVEGVEKPGNLGAVLRSADGAGVDAVIVADPVTDLWNPNTIRASLGTVFSLPLAVSSSADAMGYLHRRGIDVIAARVDGTLDYDAVDLRGSVAIVVGSETSGLARRWAGEDVRSVRIPMLGVADSLNVAATAAVLLYEARRQRRQAAPTADAAKTSLAKGRVAW